MMDTSTVESVAIPVTGGELRGRLAYRDDPVGVALVAGPHPLMGGSMENNVVRALTEGLAAKGLATVCFDYGGYGQNESDDPEAREGRLAQIAEFWASGQTPADQSMIAQVASAWAWACDSVPGARLLVGYSFGAFAVDRCEQPVPDARVLLCPTLGRHTYADAGDGVPLHILAAGDDFTCTDKALDRFVDRRSPVCYERIADTDHFLRGYEHVALRLCVQAAGIERGGVLNDGCRASTHR